MSDVDNPHTLIYLYSKHLIRRCFLRRQDERLLARISGVEKRLILGLIYPAFFESTYK